MAELMEYILQDGWGDDAASAEAANPHYSHELYKGRSESTRRNLAMVDETIIDYELIETVIEHIDANHGEGAVLVFLPGTTCSLSTRFLLRLCVQQLKCV